MGSATLWLALRIEDPAMQNKAIAVGATWGSSKYGSWNVKK